MVTKRPRARRARPRRKAPTLATVKRLISVRQETKRHFVGVSDFRPGARRVYALHPFRNLAKGVEHYQRVGDAIRDVDLHMSFSWTALGNDSLNTTRLQTGLPLRVMVVRSTGDLSALAATSWSQVTTDAADVAANMPILANTVQTVNSLVVPHPDFKVVKQFWLNSHQGTTSLMAGDTVFRQARVRIPKYYFDISSATTTALARKYNYFILITSSGSDVMSDNASVGIVQCHYMITYKDA